PDNDFIKVGLADAPVLEKLQNKLSQHKKREAVSLKRQPFCYWFNFLTLRRRVRYATNKVAETPKLINGAGG
ncbi:MAG: hypothetical protein IJO96_04400, partial [Oscillospiraceae bacterium]|nr:hypothetical protein [Oscillospiraceae bacterium]